MGFRFHKIVRFNYIDAFPSVSAYLENKQTDLIEIIDYNNKNQNTPVIKLTYNETKKFINRLSFLIELFENECEKQNIDLEKISNSKYKESIIRN